MTQERFQKLLSDSRKPHLITVDDLGEFKEDRTLIYGYTCEHETFHTYIKDGEIHTIVYSLEYNVSNSGTHPIDMREINVSVNEQYIPDKRIYPEASDYLFCALLNSRGVDLPFTTFNESRPEPSGAFYGFTIEECKKTAGIVCRGH